MKKVALTSIVFAAVSLMGSCQPAPVLAASTTTPATQPATPQNFLISPVSSAAPAGPASSKSVYTLPPAPATVHVSLLNLLKTPTDWLTERDQWNFGDATGQYATDPTAVTTGATVNLDTTLQGPVAAYQYEKPGTYAITLNRTFATGQTQTLTAQVIVPASTRTVFYIGPDGNDVNPGTDANHPLKTAGAAARLAADHTEFRFCRGNVYILQPEFSMKHRDILVDCYGDASLPLPIIQRIPATKIAAEDCMTFTTWPGLTYDITIRHVRVDSPWTEAFTADKYAYHAPTAIFGILRGSNVTVADCEFANLLEGPHGDPTATGLLFLRNRQVDPLGIPSRTLWLEGHDVVAIGNVATNSVNESPLRAASTGIVNGLVAFNDIAQQLDPAHNRATAKAASTLRTLADVAVMKNRITNGEFSFDPHSDTAQDQRILVQNNAVYNSQIDLQTNVRHAIFSGNFIRRDQGPCITINPGSSDPMMWIEDLQLINNTGQGWMPNGRMLQINPYGPNQLRGFVCDPAKNVYTKIAVPK